MPEVGRGGNSFGGSGSSQAAGVFGEAPQNWDFPFLYHMKVLIGSF